MFPAYGTSDARPVLAVSGQGAFNQQWSLKTRNVEVPGSLIGASILEAS